MPQQDGTINLRKITQENIARAREEEAERKRYVDNLIKQYQQGESIPTEAPQPKIEKPQRVIVRKPSQNLFKYSLLARGLKYKPSKKALLSDRVKVLKLKNSLERRRLQNQIERFKLQRKVEILRKKGALPTQPLQLKAMRQQPFFADAEINNDLLSMTNADVGHADGNIFGGESYYDEDFYTEDYYGTEFNNDPFFHLNLRPQRGVSPLMW